MLASINFYDNSNEVVWVCHAWSDDVKMHFSSFLFFCLSCVGPTVGYSSMLLVIDIGTGGLLGPYSITPAENP